MLSASCIRTRLRFALLKCLLMGLIGVRGKDIGDTEDQLADMISYRLIPQASFYEV